mmetsp:Transcript_8986/g.24999  ORF Transcript_8986/g.24999 Transcript_8986/m.24999 type:complete len:690 (-) Transcript_8986:95-2164(-)
MRTKAASQRDVEDVSETCVIESFCEFLRGKYGSVMKAWRRALDVHRDGLLFFSEFIDALTRVSWLGDASALWSALLRRALRSREDPAVGLRELSPEDSLCIDSFQRWTDLQFGGTIKMFQSLNSEPNGSLTWEEFQAACLKYGYEGSATTIFHEILDLDGVGAISLRDMAILESNALQREMTLNPVFEMGLEAAKAATKRRKCRDELHCQARKHALKEFRSRVRAVSGGSFIRGWRSILDQNGNLAVSHVELRKACRKIGFRGDTVALWKAMDVDDDGTALLLEVDVRMAMVLATFKKWAAEKYGCCIAALEQLAAMARLKSATWSVDEFASALCLAKFPRVPFLTGRQVATMLHEAFDLVGTGSITSQSVAFLDKWEPSPWLCADPDYDGRERLIGTLKTRYSSLIVAWRRLLDRESTNRVSYKTFSGACRALHVQNVPGVWRALDKDMTGFISLHKIDLDSAVVLQNFKQWAEITFGTVQHAFRALDTAGSNALSLPAFKRSLQNFGYTADARMLFQSLKPESSGVQRGRDPRLTPSDLRFLSFWLCGPAARATSGDEREAPAHADPPPAPSRSRRRRVEDPQAQCPRTMSSRSTTSVFPDQRLRDSWLAATVSNAFMGNINVMYPRMSEQFWYCKSAHEHKALLLSRSMADLPSIPKTAKRSASLQWDLLDTIEKDTAKQREPRPR